MSEGSNHSDSSTPEPARSAYQRLKSFIGGLWKIWFKPYDQTLQLAKYFWTAEVKGLKNGWILFCVVAVATIVAVCWVQHKVEGWIFDSGESSLRASHSNELTSVSNRVTDLKKKVDEQEGEIKSLARDRDSGRDEIGKLRIELSDVKREKEAQITQLTIEKASAQQQLSYFQALPERITKLSSNLIAAYNGEPTNREQVLTLITGFQAQFTNSLASLSQERPELELWINRQKATNNAIIAISNHEPIRITVRNSGEFTANNVQVDCIFDVKEKDLDFASDWRFQSAFVLADNRLEPVTDCAHLACVAEAPVAAGNAFSAAPIHLNSNMPPKVISAAFNVSAERSKKKQIFVSFKAGVIK